MEEFCGSELWDVNKTWNTDYPDFTDCFQKTIFIWVPCGLLWLFTPLEFYLSFHESRRTLPWTYLNISKLVVNLLLIFLSFFDMIAHLVFYLHGEDVHAVDYYTPFIKLLSYILAFILILIARKKGNQTSGVLFVFWLLLTIAEALVFQSLLRKSYNQEVTYGEIVDGELGLVMTAFYLAFALGELFFACFADYVNAPHGKKDCPDGFAAFLSKITFWWFNTMVFLGYKKPLVKEEMWNLNTENQAQDITHRFDKHWIPALQKASVSETKRVNILIPLIKTFYPTILFGASMKLIASVLTFVNPLLLNQLINFVSSDEPFWKGFLYAAAMFFSSMIESFFTNQYEFSVQGMSMRIRTSTISAIYKKTLHLSNSSKNQFTVGEIVNLMSVDTQRLMDFLQIGNLLWAAPLQIVLALYLLWQQLQISTLAGVGVMIFMIPFNGVVTYYIRKIQIGVMRNKDKRIKLMNEILSGIKMLKLYAWELSFQNKIMDTRDKEVTGLRKQAYYGAAITFAFTAAPFLIALASFSMFVLIDPSNILDANKAFVSLSLFNILRIPMALLPMLITFAAMALVSLKRINNYLSGTDLDRNAVTHNHSEYPISVEHGTFSWTKEDMPVLHNITFNIKPGQLVAVVGTVGSGKSSLLSALLGDMEKLQGSVNTKGSIAYASQQAWIQNATLRQNILFTKSYNADKYNKVLEACELKPDLEVLPGGDMTEIGEKGINLSGGQKQRVSIARAVYANADIYLLDDPLSAVDSHVGKNLFDNVIGHNGMLKNKTRILVTHRITVLPHVDNILVIKDGVLTEQGSYTELLNQKGAFADFLVQYLSEQAEDELQTPEELELVEQIVSKVPIEIQRQFSKLSGDESEPESILKKRRGTSFSNLMSDRKLSKKMSKDHQIAPKKSIAKLTEAEAAEVGSVKLAVYWQYLKASGLVFGILTMVGFTFSNSFNIGTNLWLSAWSNDATDLEKALDPKQRNLRLGVYGGLGALETIFVLLSTITLNLAAIRASQLLHHEMLIHILQAPMAFFDTTPLGRVLNRFSKDIDTMDTTIVFNIRMLIMQGFRSLVAFIVISLENPVFLVAVLPLGIIYYFIQKLYIATSRQLKRLESITRSPIYTHFSETVSGVSTIRAYGASQRFLDESNMRIDVNTSCYYPSIVATRWLAIRLEFLGYCIVFLAALFAVLTRETLTPGIAGLSISYALTITQNLNMLVRASSDVETNIVSVERTLEYTHTETEAPWHIDSAKPPSEWPDNGLVAFENYSTRYREGLPLILKDVSCSVNSGEKVGIVGRTGAGKSSLTLCLFRLIESAGGKIIIDGIDISTMGLHDLRSKLTIIPQDPVLFTGNMRLNLDPFGRYPDSELWNSLELSHLKKFVSSLPKGLDHEVSEGGENLSVGQRQLVCLARALLRKSKILVLDEATAAVDMETDDLIQSTIRSEFSDCTILTIAHRLNTIMDYDKILVLDKGGIVEYDSPSNLLMNDKGEFHSMAKDAGLI